MDSPLNLAHQQGRKADQALKNGKFEDAIFCHKRAAEHILDTMQLTASHQALESLKLQHRHHLKQQDLILSKQRKAELSQSNITKTKVVSNGLLKTSPPDTPISGSQENTSEQKDSTEGCDDLVLSDAENSDVYRTMAETDSLLQYLANRHYGNLSLKDTDLPAQRTKTTEELVAAAVKSPKGEKTIIEELRIHNEELRRHICLILKELETANSEKESLAHKLEQFEQAQALYLDNVDSEDIKLPSLDLPPLEMPHFDFDTVKHEIADNTLDESKQGSI